MFTEVVFETNAETMSDLGLLPNIFTNAIRLVENEWFHVVSPNASNQDLADSFFREWGSECLVQRQLEFSAAYRMKQNTIELSAWRCSAQLRQAVLHHIKLSWFVHREQPLFATVDL